MAHRSVDEIVITDIDFETVKECKDKRVIKRYIKLLEDDGSYFVDLMKACKEKLLEIAPKDYYLMYPRQTTSEEYDDATRDLMDWAANVSETDKALRDSKSKRNKDLIWDDEMGAKVAAPIRGQEPVLARPNVNKEPTARRIKDADHDEVDAYARDKTAMKEYYRAWDQVDVDAMEDEFDRKEAEEEAARRRHFEDLKDQQDQVHRSTPIRVAGVAEGVPEAHRRHMADNEKEKGNEAFYAKDFEEAEAYYSRSLKFKADDPSTWANRALVRLKLQRAAEALEDCEHGLALNPRYMKALHRKGKALYELQRYEEAVKYFQLALAESPGNTQINGDLMVARRKIRSDPSAPPVQAAAPRHSPSRVEELPDTHAPPPGNFTRVMIEEDSSSEDEADVTSNDRGFRKVVIEEVDGSDSEEADDQPPLGGGTGGAGGEVVGDLKIAGGGTGEATGFRKVPIVDDSGSDDEEVAASGGYAAPTVAVASAQPVADHASPSFDDMD